ncbi:hypothetical protein R3P38DRAFT_3255183 [Favolaschia claudopus]|uniref:Uncharacterized protein n=1 Tax=Favolaschia claudopus TaxID=2862362 RepID=A0AAW0DK81_9AGAR
MSPLAAPAIYLTSLIHSLTYIYLSYAVSPLVYFPILLCFHSPYLLPLPSSVPSLHFVHAQIAFFPSHDCFFVYILQLCSTPVLCSSRTSTTHKYVRRMHSTYATSARHIAPQTSSEHDMSILDTIFPATATSNILLPRRSCLLPASRFLRTLCSSLARPPLTLPSLPCTPLALPSLSFLSSPCPVILMLLPVPSPFHYNLHPSTFQPARRPPSPPLRPSPVQSPSQSSVSISVKRVS